MLDLAIVGGGPGGLMSAWYLKRKLGDLCRITIYEASDRLGGKIVTRKFDSAPAMYEAGVAEIYDYSMTGPDPLRELIQHFGLQTIPMDAEQVQFGGELLNDVAGMRRKYGAKTAAAIEAFRNRCAEAMSPIEYYEGVGAHDNENPWAYKTAEQVLDEEVEDETAKRFFKVMARSDIATESHNTNGLNALKNYLMDVDGYIGLYSIQNGNEQLIECLQSEVNADIQLNHRVLTVGKAPTGRYQLKMMNGKGPETRDFDLVLVCLPHSWLATMGWEGEQLRKSMVKHVSYFDRPAHYLRVSILFDTPFWGEKISGAWFMSEAFGGCCVYNEGARHDVGKHGVLNWLIPGSDALAFANLSDQELIDAALKSLPASLGDARSHFVEGKIHRWLSSVNAIPGGLPVRDVMTNHRPEPKEHPGIVVVGDYLFDSTLNGLLDSSDAATDIILTEMMRLRRERAQEEGEPVSDKIDRDYFENYRGLGPYSDAWRHFTDPDYLAKLIGIVWGKAKGAKLLVAGSASGELVGALRDRGIDAFGIENNRAIHARTPKALKKYNKLGSITDMPFKDGAFDFVFETSLCHVSPKQVVRAIRELNRVVKTGLVFGSITSDMASVVIDRYDLLRGVKKLGTWWEWSELFFGNGFDLSMHRKDCTDALWEATLAANKGPGQWYADADSLRYSFFDKVEDEDDD
ncbi:FAD-dependent oxidoreductase [Bradyrhizobium japonicum]|uniref:Protoporphyrinogen oxidase/SAM-dependent methyltransferase n=1 Tax=Bradyrhizobium japonicum TaxID=375 RepID=A0ABV2RUL5_BRAJP|nr:FAD-dependent oxidoreductase [Bradyrhizobium japonicum]MBR0747842.1 FAD-dependent oxidoreductase [Bradyrhizobium japonicum]MCP1765060.1 protoporphyrinogen oxidase/SAM-dependent methyltransferase [Bradyrhizobium japonicum]MCP1787197.1 protoporphyrinogen oxidase/SAM-dependent methyltransferase [Bradyrhizobium japonicum]MCP1809074.1 protoporphyrinogen oxidase/SAM-dependent methyltransferase [Bradyrhizobium japonicum]MCP1818004.1 protoporphyrinogen oxidase/SAM-dependent methyltransferase [Brady